MLRLADIDKNSKNYKDLQNVRYFVRRNFHKTIISCNGKYKYKIVGWRYINSTCKGIIVEGVDDECGTMYENIKNIWDGINIIYLSENYKATRYFGWIKFPFREGVKLE